MVVCIQAYNNYYGQCPGKAECGMRNEMVCNGTGYDTTFFYGLPVMTHPVNEEFPNSTQANLRGSPKDAKEMLPSNQF